MTHTHTHTYTYRHTYICVEYYSAMKKNETMPFASAEMNLEIITLSEVSQKEKDKIPHDTTCVWNLKSGTNELAHEVDSQTETDLWSRGQGAAGGVGTGRMGVWNRRQKPLHVEWRAKAILCSTGNCLQHPVQSHTGKEPLKVCINIHQTCSGLCLVVRA